MVFTYCHIWLVVIIDGYGRKLLAHLLDSRDECRLEALILLKSFDGLADELKVHAFVILGVQEEIWLERGFLRWLEPVYESAVSWSQEDHFTTRTRTSPAS